MSTSTPSFEEIDSLSLLAHKVAPHVYDLSSRQINVSIRDQMVRAQQLVRDLHKADANAKSLLIVGMGAAGMTAALSACEVGFEQVCVVDVATEPFALFEGVHSRFVGPYMYEWPSPFHGDQSYPSHEAAPWSKHGRSSLQWAASEPISADALGRALRRGLREWLTASPPKAKVAPLMRVGVGKRVVKSYLKRYVGAQVQSWRDGLLGLPKSPPPPLVFTKAWGEPWGGASASSHWPAGVQPDHIILAAGMGTEVLSVPGGGAPMTPRFWANDKLKRPDVAHQCVVVLGGGDGAMQDALRSVTRFDHPLQFIRHLEAKPVVRQLLEAEVPALLSADRQMRQHSSWSSDPVGFAMVDAACVAAAQRLSRSPAVRAQVVSALRPGRGQVRLLAKGAHFDKAYLLNRFAVYLLAHCVCPATEHLSNAGGMGFDLKFGVEVLATHEMVGGGAPSWILEIGPADESDVDVVEAHHIVVRFGIDTASIPGLQMIQLTDPSLPGANSRQRTTLSRVELPFVAMRGA